MIDFDGYQAQPKYRKAYYKRQTWLIASILFTFTTGLFLWAQLVFFGFVEPIRAALPIFSAGVIFLAFARISLYDYLTKHCVKDRNGEILYYGDNVALLNEHGVRRYYGSVGRVVDGKAETYVSNILYFFEAKPWSLSQLEYLSYKPNDLDQLLLAYDCDLHGDTWVVSGPGKFESEPLHVAYYYTLFGQGAADGEIGGNDDDTPLAYFTVSNEAKELFPELRDEKYIGIWESVHGFVYAEDTEQVESLLADEAKRLNDDSQSLPLAA